MEVTLREVTADTVRAVCELAVGPDQDGLVAPNSVSIAQAYFEPKAWFRAIYAGEEPANWFDLRVGRILEIRNFIDGREGAVPVVLATIPDPGLTPA